MRSRDYRRRHKRRMQRRAELLIGPWATRLGDHMAACSCQMCRNPRRSSFGNQQEKLTPQERQTQDDIEMYFIDEVCAAVPALVEAIKEVAKHGQE